MYNVTVHSQNTKTFEFKDAAYGNVRNAALNWIAEVLEDRKIHNADAPYDFVVTYRKAGDSRMFLDLHSCAYGRRVSREEIDTATHDQMATCHSCNNDHGIISVRMGMCPYEYN